MYKSLLIIVLIYVAFPLSGNCGQVNHVSIEELCDKYDKLQKKIQNIPVTGVVPKVLLNPEYDDFHNSLEPSFTFPSGSVRKYDELNLILNNNTSKNKNVLIIAGDQKSPLSNILFNKILKHKEVNNILDNYKVVYVDLTFRNDEMIYKVMKDFRIFPDMIKYIPKGSDYKVINKNYLHSTCVTPKELLAWLSEMDKRNKRGL